MSSSLVFVILSASNAPFSRRFARVFPCTFSPNKLFADHRNAHILWNGLNANSQLQLTSASLSPPLQIFRSFSNENQNSEINVENLVNEALAPDSGTKKFKKEKKEKKNFKENTKGQDGKNFKPKSSSEGFGKKKDFGSDKQKRNTKKDWRKGNTDVDSPKKNFGRSGGRSEGRSQGRPQGRPPGRPQGRSEGRSQGGFKGKFEEKPERRFEKKN